LSQRLRQCGPGKPKLLKRNKSKAKYKAKELKPYLAARRAPQDERWRKKY
jgi:hypothetical protein